MILTPFGNITTTSTTVAVRATLRQADQTKSYFCQAISFQVLSTNTGVVYICSVSNPDLITGLGVMWELPISDGATRKSRPAWVVGDPSAKNPVNAAEFYILPEVSGEGVRVGTYRTGTKQINWP